MAEHHHLVGWQVAVFGRESTTGARTSRNVVARSHQGVQPTSRPTLITSTQIAVRDAQPHSRHVLLATRDLHGRLSVHVGCTAKHPTGYLLQPTQEKWVLRIGYW